MSYIALAAVVCGIFILAILTSERGRYRPGRNPAQRICVDCGQEQNAFCHTLEDWDQQWWEAQGEIKDPTCKCHKDVI